MAEFVVGNIFIRDMEGKSGSGLQPGEVIEGHLHAFDHVSIFFNGQWRVRKWYPDKPDEIVFDFIREAPFFVHIEAQAKHEFTYIAGEKLGRAWCVFSHRHKDGTVSETETGFLQAYGAKG
jgi:hypothetical protein